MTAPLRRWRRWRPHALALAAYALCAVAVTWPLALHMGDSLAANEFGQVDGLLSVWNLWWSARALSTGQSPFFTPLLFYPQGLDLFWLWLSLPNGLLAAPVTLAAGPLLAYNLTTLAGYALGGYTAFLFIRRHVRDDAAALVGGALFALTPFHMRRVLDGVMDTAAVQWVPLYLLALHAMLDRPRWWGPLLCGALALWVGLGSWYYGLFCLIYTGMAALLRALRPPDGRRAPDWAALAWGLSPGVVWAALVAPQLAGLVVNGDRLLGVGLHANASNSADLVDFFLPNPFHPLWGAAVTAWHERLRPDAWLWQVSFGWTALALAAAGLRARWREAWPWLALLAGCMLLAAGERLTVLGRDTGVPMPYALLAGLPGIRTSHRPNHILLIGALLLALLAAFGARALFARLPRWRAPLAAALVASALLVDGWAGPLPLYRPPLPAGYAALPPHAGGGLLAVPLNLNVARSEQLWYQTAHGWPIVGGYTGREPPYPLGKYAPGIRELRYARATPDDIVSPGWPGDALAMLAALDIRYVALHPDLMRASAAPVRELVGQLGLAPSYRDASLELYPVPPAARLRPVAYLGEGWGGLERDGARRWRWLGDGPGTLYVYVPKGEGSEGGPREVSLDLRLEAFGRDRPLEVRVDGGAPLALTATRAEMRRSLRLLLGPGEHVVYFSAPADPPEGRSGPLRSVSFLDIAVR